MRMPRNHRYLQYPQNGRSGLSLLEVTFATMIVGGLMVAALQTVGGATRSSRANADQAIGQLLAQDLMAEILNTQYVESTESPAVFGPESTETGGTRASFDDVDDYDQWIASPPESKDGTPLANRSSWRREVVVRYVDRNDLSVATAADDGVKEITVSVFVNNRLASQRITIRTDVDTLE